jgi:hypothetical protein
MKFDFKFGDKKTSISTARLVSAAGFFWQKISKIVLVVFLGAMIFLGGYIWQKSLSGGAWSDEKKQEYLDTQNKEVILNESSFEKAFLNVEMRKKNISNDNTKVRKNIFKTY